MIDELDWKGGYRNLLSLSADKSLKRVVVQFMPAINAYISHKHLLLLFLSAGLDKTLRVASKTDSLIDALWQSKYESHSEDD